tara:strand:- start:118 stop:456 length:339 start_codon:yes stop_codon:yes gene_type:complete
MNIGKWIKGAVIDASGYVGNLVGGPVGEKVGRKITTELLTKEEGDNSGFQPISTAVSPVRFSSNFPYSRPPRSRASVDYAKAVNAQTLNAFWETRFDRYYTQAYKIKRIERT